MKFPLEHAKKYGLIVFFGMLLLFTSDYLGIFEGINNHVYDIFFRLRGTAEPDKRILIAAIDEKTLDQLGRWPLRRIHFAHLLDRLNEAGVVGFDIIMAEPSEDDVSLAQAVRRQGRVVLPAYIERSSHLAYSVSSLTPRQAGHVHLEQDVDGIVRKIYHTLYTGDHKLPSFSSAIYETLTGQSFPREDPGGANQHRAAQSGILQMDLRKINFYGPPGTVPRISLIDIINGSYSADFFTNKIVLVGVTAAGVEADVLTPFTQQRDRMSGIECHAQTLSNIIDRTSIIDISLLTRLSASLFFALLGLIFFIRVDVRRAALLWVLGIAAASLFAYGLFVLYHRWFSPVLFSFMLSYLCLVSYIFKLEQAGDRLGEAKRDWEESFHTINDAIVLMDRDGHMLRMNEAAGVFLKPALQDILVKRCLRLQETAGHASVAGKDQTAAVEQTETEDIRDPETDRWFDIKSLPRLDGKGSFIGAVHVVRDITARKRAEETAAQEKIFTDTVIDCLPGVFFICDEEGRLIRWNENGKALSGYSPQELSQMNILKLFLYDREMLTKKMNEVLTYGRSDVEASLITKSGASLPFYLTGARMVINQTRYIVGMGIDVSERKQLEQQLLQAQKMESIGQLAGGVAHDFNNILSAIIGYGSILQMKMPPQDPLRANVDRMLESADRAAQLTHSLLAFSRKQVMYISTTQVNGIIGQQEKFLRRIIGEDIELKTVLRGNAVILADSAQIEQVLMNLAANARDAMPSGGNLLIETDVQEMTEQFLNADGPGEPGAYAVISVTDTGAGMDEETRKRIFEPFFTTKKAGKGTGLGLAIVYGIVKQHKGYINVFSEVGKGSTFRIYFPVYHGPVENRSTAIVEPSMKTGTETILLAEDDVTLRTFCRDILTEFGYILITAEDGEDAINKFREQQDKIRICILDMIMPKKSGREVYEAVQKMKPGTKVIFVSGYTADKVQQEALPGDCEFITKPASPQVILSKIRKVLDREKGK